MTLSESTRRGSAHSLIENLRVNRGLLLSLPSLKETLEELYIRREMSTSQIADIFGVNRVTVFQWLKKLRVPLRDRVEAYIKAVTKYVKTSFSDNLLEKAYMMGLRLSDYDARWAHREGGSIIMRTRTTHQGMIQLAYNTFATYGGFVARPREINRGGYCWEIECYLDNSFSFLVPKPQGILQWILHEPQAFLHCFAALVDGDGWVGLHNCWSVKAIAKLGFSNTDHQLVKDVAQGLLSLGYVTRPRVDKERGSMSSFGPLNNSVLRLEFKGNNAIKLLKVLPLRHPEKLARRSLALKLHGKAWEQAKPEWDKLLSSIDAERDKCVADAKVAYNARKNCNQKSSRMPPFRENA